MTGIVSVYAVFADAAEARRIARIVVEERLAACANILGPCPRSTAGRARSRRPPRSPPSSRPRAETAAALIARIAALHSYDVPAAVAWPIADALAGYAAWVVENSGDSP